MRPILAMLSLLALALSGPTVQARPAQSEQDLEKPRLAIRAIEATDPVMDAARAQGQAAALEQILAAADSQLLTAVSNTRRFDIVARSDLATVFKEQDLAGSGFVDPADPQAARAYAMAGARYVATVTVDNYQDATATADFEGGLGETTMERRTVQLQATLKIYDTTTGVLLASAPLFIEDSDVRETLPGATQTGRLTNALLGRVASRLARDTANTIMDTIAPARVLAYTMGQITLNRGQGTGIEPGQVWRIFHTGAPLIDPDTGEVLGSEEIPVGWARITEVTPKFSKAQAVEDMGIANGAILRLAPQGLPPGVDADARATGSASRPVPTPTPSAQPDSSTPTPTITPTTDDSRGTAATPGDGATANPQNPRRVAVFVRDVSPEVPDHYTDALETLVTASVAGPGVEVISRALVLNAVSELSTRGANRGGDDGYADAAARLLSDQASALSMARTLGADSFLVATIADLSESRRRFNDPDIKVNTDIAQTTLTLTWNVIAGDTGGSLGSGMADATSRVRQSEGLSVSAPDIGELLKQAARTIGADARRTLLADTTRATQPAQGEVAVRVDVSMQDLSVPDIRKIDGEWVVTADQYLLEPRAVDILADGFLVGTAPGSISLSPGPHRLRVEQPGLEPVDRFIVAREGMTLTIPMRLSDEGMTRWMRHATFLEGLKDGASLRRNEEKIAEGIAEFLRNSRLNLDTSSLESISSDSFWHEFFKR